MTLNVFFQKHSGTVWFDDIIAAPYSNTALFDSQKLEAPQLPTGTTSGWFVRDVAANSTIQLLRSQTGADGPAVANLGLRLTDVQDDGQTVATVNASASATLTVTLPPGTTMALRMTLL